MSSQGLPSGGQEPPRARGFESPRLAPVRVNSPEIEAQREADLIARLRARQGWASRTFTAILGGITILCALVSLVRVARREDIDWTFGISGGLGILTLVLIEPARLLAPCWALERDLGTLVSCALAPITPRRWLELLIRARVIPSRLYLGVAGAIFCFAILGESHAAGAALATATAAAWILAMANSSTALAAWVSTRGFGYSVSVAIAISLNLFAFLASLGGIPLILRLLASRGNENGIIVIWAVFVPILHAWLAAVLFERAEDDLDKVLTGE